MDKMTKTFLRAVFLALMLTLQVQASNNGVGDQDLNIAAGTEQGSPGKPLQCGTSCHTVSSGGAAVSISASPSAPYTAGQTGINIQINTENITENDDILGVILLDNARPLSGNIKNEGWTITQDPNNNPTKYNFNEKTDLESLNQAYIWTVTAPGISGVYYIKAQAMYGGATSFNVTSNILAMQVMSSDWNSYNDDARTIQDDSFASSEKYVYMSGTGFKPGYSYNVVYYDGNNNKAGSETVNSFADGTLESQYNFPSNTNAAPGMWHAVVYETTPPNTYNPGDVNRIADDSFSVQSSTMFYTISGYVIDSYTTTPLNGSNVTLDTGLLTNTNVSGFYNFFNLVNGNYRINASLFGYFDNSTSKTISGADITDANITLSPIPCTDCHYSFSYMNNSGRQDLYVNQTMVNESVHESLNCRDCHTGGHNRIYARKVCEDCHANKQNPETNKSRHNIVNNPWDNYYNGISAANITSCITCHDSTLYNNAKNTYGKDKGIDCDYCHSFPDNIME